MIDYKCPHCGSDNIQKFAIAHDSLGERDKSYRDNNGKLHVLTEYSRPDLAPPKLPDNGSGCVAPILVYTAASFFVFFGFALKLQEIGYAGLVVMAIAFLYPFITSKAHKRKHAELLAKYHEEKALYDRSYICLRCGKKFIL